MESSWKFILSANNKYNNIYILLHYFSKILSTIVKDFLTLEINSVEERMLVLNKISKYFVTENWVQFTKFLGFFRIKSFVLYMLAVWELVIVVSVISFSVRLNSVYNDFRSQPATKIRVSEFQMRNDVYFHCK